MKALPFIPVEHTAEAVMKFTRNGQQLRTVLHFKKGDASEFTSAELAVLGNGMNTAWVAHMRSTHDELTFYNGCTVQSLTAEDAGGVDVPLTADTQGTGVSGTPLPNNVTAAIKKLTGLRGRSFRGRIYHIGIASGYLADVGHLSAGTVTAYLNQWELFFAEIHALAGAFVHVVVSRYSGVENVIVGGRYKRQAIPRDAGVATPVTSLQMDATLDSQRRRLPGRGL